jgi:hypothetical protein
MLMSPTVQDVDIENNASYHARHNTGRTQQASLMMVPGPDSTPAAD